MNNHGTSTGDRFQQFKSNMRLNNHLIKVRKNSKPKLYQSPATQTHKLADEAAARNNYHMNGGLHNSFEKNEQEMKINNFSTQNKTTRVKNLRFSDDIEQIRDPNPSYQPINNVQADIPMNNSTIEPNAPEFNYSRNQIPSREY
jgi:hypothetical protein